MAKQQGPDSSGPDSSGTVATPSGHRLHTESFGSESDPALLMIMGGNAPSFTFPDSLCRALASQGYRVVRYDHRGAGHSSPVAFPEESYTLDDLAQDAAAVIRQLGLDPAAVYGISTGGAVAQLLALDYADLVRALVLMATSPDYNVAPTKAPETGLPLPGTAWVSLLDKMVQDPPTDHASIVAAYLEGWRVCAGSAIPFDEDYWRDLVERTLRLPDNPAPGSHQGPAVDAAPPRTDRLAQVTVPTLVIHGGHDQVLPPEHGRALAAAIPGARLVEIPELGHMFPPSFSDRLVELITEHVPPDPNTTA